MSDLRVSLIHLVSSDFSSQFGGLARSVARGGEMAPAGILPFFRRPRRFPARARPTMRLPARGDRQLFHEERWYSYEPL